jgi:hypothetical protein
LPKEKFCSLLKKAIKKASSVVIEQKKYSVTIYFVEILLMLGLYFHKKLHRVIFFLVLSLMYLSPLMFPRTTMLNFLATIIFYLFVIPFQFLFNLKNKNRINNFTYIKLNILYLLIPTIATIQYLISNEITIVFTSVMISFYCPYIIYECFTIAKIEKKTIYFLKYFNFVLSTCFTILFYVINVYWNAISNILFIIILSPLLILYISYERYLLEIDFPSDKN